MQQSTIEPPDITIKNSLLFLKKNNTDNSNVNVINVNVINVINILKKLILEETSTTAYMLRALESNYIGTIPFNIIKVNEMDTINSYKIILPPVKPRLIMVFGPSASGKTTSSNEMIKLFSTKYTDFPTCFMTLDGGKCRKASILYQMIIGYSLEYNVDITKYNIFPKVKQKLIQYYENQRSQYNTMISLYIPITLGKSYLQSYSKYIEMTNDYNWIGIFIWQHKFECSYEGVEKCNGCVMSGMEREKIEGKKYKNYKWEGSMEKGLIEVKKAPGGFYYVHNNGKKDRNYIITTEWNIFL